VLGIEDLSKYRIGMNADVEIELAKNTDVLVIPSTHDGCPNVLLESMLAGTPVISTKTGAMKEILEDCECGSFFDVYDASDLANKITTLLNNPYETRKKSILARDYIYRNLSKEYEINEWTKLYEIILN